MPSNANPALEILEQAQNLIRDPEHWITDYYASDNRGDLCEPSEERATCFCSVGAVMRASGTSGLNYRRAKRLLDQAVEKHAPNYAGIVDYNDSHTHADVMRMFNKAKEMAREHP